MLRLFALKRTSYFVALRKYPIFKYYVVCGFEINFCNGFSVLLSFSTFFIPFPVCLYSRSFAGISSLYLKFLFCPTNLTDKTAVCASTQQKRQCSYDLFFVTRNDY